MQSLAKEKLGKLLASFSQKHALIGTCLGSGGRGKRNKIHKFNCNDEKLLLFCSFENNENNEGGAAACFGAPSKRYSCWN